MEEILILAGDAAKDLNATYPTHRLHEAAYRDYVALPTRQKVKFVVHDFE